MPSQLKDHQLPLLESVNYIMKKCLDRKAIPTHGTSLSLKVKVKVKVKPLSRVQLCDPVDCNLLGFSVHGSLQARILERVAISLSRRSSQSGDRSHIPRASCTGRQVLYHQRHLQSPRRNDRSQTAGPLSQKVSGALVMSHTPVWVISTLYVHIIKINQVIHRTYFILFLNLCKINS